jgi:hypothetical protein
VVGKDLTPSGIADIPRTDRARQAFEDQLRESEGSDYLFPATKPKSARPYLTTLK